MNIKKQFIKVRTLNDGWVILNTLYFSEVTQLPNGSVFLRMSNGNIYIITSKRYIDIILKYCSI